MRRAFDFVVGILIAAGAAFAAATVAGGLLQAIGVYDQWSGLVGACAFVAAVIFIRVGRR
jgi:hypothetical protein